MQLRPGLAEAELRGFSGQLFLCRWHASGSEQTRLSCWDSCRMALSESIRSPAMPEHPHYLLRDTLHKVTAVPSICCGRDVRSLHTPVSAPPPPPPGSPIRSAYNFASSTWLSLQALETTQLHTELLNSDLLSYLMTSSV